MYKKVLLNERVHVDGTATKQIQVYRSDHKEITPAEIKELTLQIMKKYNHGSVKVKGHASELAKDEQNNVLIRGLAIDRWSTLKAWDADIDDIEDNDYLNGRVKDQSKFKKYYQLEISLIIPKL